MSGGSLDYVSHRVEEAAREIRQCADREEKSVQDSLLAFADHVSLVANALHDVEWYLSGDTGFADAVKSIRKVFAAREARVTKSQKGDTNAKHG